jgi:hypothetical protein
MKPYPQPVSLSHSDRGVQPNQYLAGNSDDVPQAHGHHRDPTRWPRDLLHIQQKFLTGVRKVGASLLQEDLTSTDHFARSGPGDTKGQEINSNLLHTHEIFPPDILRREGDLQDAEVGPSHATDSRRGARAGVRVSFAATAQRSGDEREANHGRERGLW